MAKALHSLMRKAALAALLLLGLAAPSMAATLYISEFPNALSQVGSTSPQVYPQPALTDQTVAISGSSTQSNAFGASTRAVIVECDADCSVVFGSNPTATTTNYLMGDGIPYQFAVTPGQKIAVIANTSGGNGSDVNIVAVGGTAVSSPLPVSPQATENHIGETGSNQTALTIAQTVTASSAYATGNAIGGLMTITGAARVSGTSGASGTGGLLQSVGANFKDAQTTPIDVFVFKANPSGSTCTDKTAFALATADFDKVLGVVHMNDFTAGNTASFGQTQNLAMPYTLSSATSLFACAVTRSTPTYGSTSDVSFGFQMLRD